MELKPGKLKDEISWKGLKDLIVIVVVIVGLQSFFYKPFYIPSGSMIPSLLIGDNLFVNKWVYGYSKYSFPFGYKLNYFQGRIWESQPKLGDVVVFRANEMVSQDFIKRLVGLPGDKLQMIDGRLYINGYLCPLKRIEDSHYYDDSGEILEAPQFIETLPNGKEHLIIKSKPFGAGRLDNTPEFVVPEGHYFMMGDNRDGSNDSRAQSLISFVPAENLVGRADRIFFSTGSHAMLWEIWKWATDANYDRIFKGI